MAAAILAGGAAPCHARSITFDESDAPNGLHIAPSASSIAQTRPSRRQSSSQSPETSTVAGSYLIYDAFTGADNTALVGRFPPTDTLGVAYKGNGNVSLAGGITGGTPYEADIQSNAARLGADAGLGVDLTGNTAMQLQLSIMFNISGDSQTQTDDAHRGAGLGFFSSVNIASSGSSHGFNNFTGLVVDRTGSIRLFLAAPTQEFLPPSPVSTQAPTTRLLSTSTSLRAWARSRISFWTAQV
ncbi:MAG: hypothetical protein M3119_00220 [Verrucomicrobiota bacterium]|nr:hypothetical protein [Verrucomicrobiota bacterium]MDQ6938563.1 hypothetical protein [Verrucomicrobiota bacterium]